MTGWTRELVLEELIHAFEVDDALPIRVGPRSYGSSMPEYQHDRTDWFLAGADADRQTKKARNDAVLRRSRITAAEISRADAAFGWVTVHVFDLELRHVLFAHAMVKARKWNWDRYVEKRNRRNPTKKAWVKRTVYRWIAYATQSIADALNKSGVLLPSGADLHVAQIPAETPSEPIRCGSSAWSAPGRAA